MITINELRVGNLLNHIHSKSYINWSLQDFQRIYNDTLDLQDIEPILITEEWLVRFGFELKHGSNENGNSEYKNQEVFLPFINGILFIKGLNTSTQPKL